MNLRNSNPHRRPFSRPEPAWRLRPVALALACMGAGPALAQATLPSWNNFLVRGGVVSVGTPTAEGTRLGITQSSQRAIVDWQGFSIGQGHTVTITQPNVSSVLLNRVTGAEASTIAGSLHANGRVFLVNPNGVLFTGTSSVNVGGLVASALKMSTSDDAFMGGTERIEFAQDPNVVGGVTNNGSITAQGLGGTVALIGATVTNNGSIVAQGGTAAMASGETVTVDFAGDGLTTFKLTPGTYGTVANGGLVQADGGRVLLLATSAGEVTQGVVNTGGLLRANSLASRNGEIVLDSGSSDAGVTINSGALLARGEGTGQTGGSIEVKGRTVLVQPIVLDAVSVPGAPIDLNAHIDASGDAGGGRILLQATAVPGLPQTGAIAIAAGSVVRADATGTGHGGDVRVMAERTLRAYGSLSARGGPGGGDGGFIETSGGYAVPAGDNNGGIELTGLRADASAPAGRAGKWEIDPYDVTIVNGAAAGTLPGNPFDPIATSTLQDGDINAALNSGTSVRITTGSPAVGLPNAGDITLDDVFINYTAALGPLTFQLDANRSVRGNGASVIASSGAGGPLNVIFNADANGLGAAVGGGQVSYSGSIYSNGGNVAMSGAWANSSNLMCSVCLTNAIVDTRTGNQPNGSGGFTGGSNAGTGGNVTLTGLSTGASFGAQTAGAVWLQDSVITSATGNVSLFGAHTAGSGVQIDRTQAVGGIDTTSGNITITGIGSFTANSTEAPGHGVVINGAAVASQDGDIAVAGRRLAGGTAAGSGVLLRNGALLQTTGVGDIDVAGQSDGNGAGVAIATLAPAGGIDGHQNVVLRASNDGSTDALAIGGPVSAGSVLDLRPGGVDLTGQAQDRTAIPIDIGGNVATGFAVSSAELALIDAPTLVVGSNAHAAAINVTGALTTTGALTLQNGGGGNIVLGAPVSAAQLGLESAGDITQAAGAPITAGVLLARSSGGSVDLRHPLNNVGTLGGAAAGNFAYVDSDAITVGPVSVTGYDAAGNRPQTLSATSMAADTVFVRTLVGDLTLTGNVSSAAGTDLVAAARFQNPGSGSLSGAPWRVWADTWVGESRGGVTGSGLLPNLYHCAYLGLCTVAVSSADNHFIYAQQPAATVRIGNAQRAGGLANPLFTYSITGLILGDTGRGFAGALSSPALPASLPGIYPINGSFTSAEGYAVTVVPGTLSVGDFVQLPKPDVLRDMPTSWLYDRNIGPAPICFATGPLDGDRASQEGDVLAREWSRVRSRPNLTSCVDTERRNGCADF